MPRKTVAQIRASQVDLLAHYRTDNPTEQDFAKARTLLNSYYRLCALADRNLILSNDARTCNSRYCAESEKKEEKWIGRLSGEMREFNGLIIDYYGGYIPEILQVMGPKSTDRRQVITPYFYS